MTEAEERQVDAGLTRDRLIKQLAWELLNAYTPNAVSAVNKDDIHKCVVATHGMGPIDTMMASIKSLVMD